MSELPNSWSKPSLGDVIDIQGGSQPPKKDFIEEPKAGYVRMLQIRDFKNDKNPVYIPKDKAKRWCEADDLLIGRYGASVGRICTGKSGSYNVALAKVIYPRGYIDRLWMEYYLRAPEFQRAITNLGGRAAQAGFNKDDIASMSFPIAPIGEQKRVANKIETCFEKVDATDEALKKAEALIGKYKEALLAKAFRGELVPQEPNDEPASQLLERIRAEQEQADKGKKHKKKTDFAPITDEEKPFDIPASWDCVRIGELFELGILVIHKDGNHGSSYPRKDEFVSSGVPYLSAKCLDGNGGIDFTKVTYLSEQKAKSLKIGHVAKGDVLFAHNATVGPTAIVDLEFDDIVIGTSLTCYRPNPSILDPRYLYSYLTSSIFQRQVKKVMKQSTRNQVPVLKQREFYLVLPPIKEQRLIVDVVDKLNESLRSFDDKIERLFELPSMLRRSILSKAFTGQLVNQIEAEGTGHQLLEEILAERAKLEVAKPKKTTEKKKTRKRKS